MMASRHLPISDSADQALYSNRKFCLYGKSTGSQIQAIFSIRLLFTQKLVGELPFSLHQNGLHIKEHFHHRKFLKRFWRHLNTSKYQDDAKVSLH